MPVHALGLGNANSATDWPAVLLQRSLTLPLGALAPPRLRQEETLRDWMTQRDLEQRPRPSHSVCPGGCRRGEQDHQETG